MKGHNSMTLCEAQVQIIVQEWIDRNMTTKPLVTAVRGGNGSGARTFEVMLSDEERTLPADDGPPRVGDLVGWIGHPLVARVSKVEAGRVWGRWSPGSDEDTYLALKDVRIIERTK